MLMNINSIRLHYYNPIAMCKGPVQMDARFISDAGRGEWLYNREYAYLLVQSRQGTNDFYSYLGFITS